MTDSLERFLHDLHFTVPAGLVDRANAAAAVASEMQDDTVGLGQSTVPGQPSRQSGLLDRKARVGRQTELAVGIAAVIIAAIVIGTFAYIRAVTSPSPVAPAAAETTIKQYQARIGADQQATLNFLDYQCTVNPPESAACADSAAVAISALQGWLDDLNQSSPPARFAAIDGRMRRHLTVGMADLRAVIAANKAMDAGAAAAAVTASQDERDTLNREASAVLFSSQETALSYSGIVRMEESKLLACDLCQMLLSLDQPSCQPSHTPSCVDEIAATRVQVETFQDDLVRGFAPSPLAVQDRRLQTDLLDAGAALDAMASALSAGDQVQLEAGRSALRHALGRVDSDATDIARGV